jgi:CelD/BcsL family acetyltransferase involved in cellulose biosynthesis
MAAEVVRPDELGAAELRCWSRLQAGNPRTRSPFLAPGFALEIARLRPKTRVAVLTGDEGISAFLPFERRGSRGAVALGIGLSDAQGLVVRADLPLDLGQVLAAAGLSWFRADHLLGAQGRCIGTGYGRFRTEVSPTLDLRGGYEAYVWSRRNGTHQPFQSVAKRRRKLERAHGPLRLVLHEPDHAALDQVLAWKSGQYRRTGKPNLFAHAPTRDLLHRLLDAQEPGFAGILSLLKAGDTTVAGHFGLRSPTTLARWFPAYDPAFAAYSPGLQLALEMARAAADDGIETMDLGKGDEQHKERLANAHLDLLNGFVTTDRLTLLRRTARAWPEERAKQVVLRSPRLRRWAFQALAVRGGMREPPRVHGED